MQIVKPRLKSITVTKLFFIVLIVLHFSLVLIVIPIHKIKHIGEFPISHGDYPYHYGQISENLENFEKYRQAWGYSALFYAGYLTGITTISSSRMWLVFVFLLKQLSIPVVVSFNIFPIILIICTPFLFVFTLKKFELNPSHSILATFLMMIYFWSSKIFYYYIKWGLISFIFSMFLVLFCLSHFYQFLKSDKNVYLNSILLTLLISLAGWFHPLSAIPIIIGCSILFLSMVKEISFLKNFILIFIIAITLTTQLPWLLPLLSIKAMPNISIGNQFAAQQFNLAGGFPQAMGKVAGESANTTIHRLLLFFSIPGWYYLWKIKQKVVGVFLCVFPIFLIIIKFWGTPINYLEPGRFGPIAMLIMTIPASVGIMFIFHKIFKDKINNLKRFSFCCFLLLMIWPRIPIIVENLSTYSLIHPPSLETTKLINWIKTNTKEDGRILYETSYYENKNNVDNGHLNLSCAGYIGSASGREFIGGPMEWNGPLDFINGKLSGIPISNISIREIKQFIELYNIHWIVVFSRESKIFFERYPDVFKKISEINYFDIFKVTTPSTFFFAGNGKILYKNGELLISEIVGNNILIKYHWVPFLNSYPVVEIEREIVSNDPFGFIKISNPPGRIKIWAQK